MKTSNKILMTAGCVPIVIILIMMIGTMADMRHYTDNSFSFSAELFNIQRAKDAERITEEEYDILRKGVLEDRSHDIDAADLQKARDIQLITEEEYASLKNGS